MHSAWIGEHHFDSLGVNSRPGTLLASIVPVTTHIRLAPAVAVLPLHHPLDVAEEWATLDLISGGRVDFAAGRGYDRREYAPFGTPYMESAELFDESIEVILKAWNSPGPWSPARPADGTGRGGAPLERATLPHVPMVRLA